MSRVPARLQPLWPVVKFTHRHGARVTGLAGRHLGGRRRGLPWTATESSLATVEAEPGGAALHVVTPGRVLTRPRPVGDPAGHREFERGLVQSVPASQVLDLTDGLLLGRHVAVVTAEGRLDHETSKYFGCSRWTENPLFWNPWPPVADRVEGTVGVLAARGTAGNYYHFLIDALPRLGLLEQACPGVVPDVWVADRRSGYQRQLLEMVGVDQDKVREPGPGFALRARRLLVPSLPNADMLVGPETVEWLSRRLPARDTAGRPTHVYLTRGTTPHTRRFVEEDALMDRLAKRGFAMVDPGRLTVQEQIDHFAAARVIVAPHGAGLANLVFCRPGVRVLEMFAPGFVSPCYWSIVSGIPDARYRYLLAPGSPRGKGNHALMQDIRLDPAAVETALDQLLAD